MEEWKSLNFLGYPNYAVSNYGRVFSFNRGGAILKQHHNGCGYLHVGLSYRGKRRTVRVHALVAFAFIGTKPSGFCTLHGDGRKDNNRADNLRYGTHSENFIDALRHGTRKRGIGENNAMSILSDGDVIKIRHRHHQGESQVSLAKEYGVRPPAINKIVLGKSWKHTGGPIWSPRECIRAGGEKALEIRAAYENGEGSQRVLARRFGMSRCSVQRIIRNKTYRGVQ